MIKPPVSAKAHSHSNIRSELKASLLRKYIKEKKPSELSSKANRKLNSRPASDSNAKTCSEPLFKRKAIMDPRMLKEEYFDKESRDQHSKTKSLNYTSFNLRSYWNHMLKIAQWIQFGKDYKMYVAYEKSIMNPRGSGDEDIPAPYSDQDVMKRLHLNLADNKKRPLSYYKYLYFDHILPVASNRAKTQDIDLQALETALAAILDCNIPIDLNRLITFFETDVTELVVFDHKKPSIPAQQNCSIFEIRNHIPVEDWNTIRNIYIEFKMKGVISVKHMIDKILKMVSKEFSRDEKLHWYQSVTPMTRFCALKLGALFLNIFHACYLAACKEPNLYIAGNRVAHRDGQQAAAASQANKDNPAQKRNKQGNNASVNNTKKSGAASKKIYSGSTPSKKLSSGSTPSKKPVRPGSAEARNNNAANFSRVTKENVSSMRRILSRKNQRIRYDKRIPPSLVEEFKRHMFA